MQHELRGRSGEHDLLDRRRAPGSQREDLHALDDLLAPHAALVLDGSPGLGVRRQLETPARVAPHDLIPRRDFGAGERIAVRTEHVPDEDGGQAIALQHDVECLALTEQDRALD